MKSKDFYKLCDRIDASIREQRPDISALGRQALVLDTLEMLRESIDRKSKKRKPITSVKL